MSVMNSNLSLSGSWEPYSYEGLREWFDYSPNTSEEMVASSPHIAVQSIDKHQLLQNDNFGFYDLSTTATKVTQNSWQPIFNQPTSSPIAHEQQEIPPVTRQFEPVVEGNLHKRNYTIFNQSNTENEPEKMSKTRKVHPLPSKSIDNEPPQVTISTPRRSKGKSLSSEKDLNPQSENIPLTQEQKIDRRREKNRLSAQASRERKQQEIQQLSKKNLELEQENEGLVRDNTRLRQKIKHMRPLLSGPSSKPLSEQEQAESQNVMVQYLLQRIASLEASTKIQGDTVADQATQINTLSAEVTRLNSLVGFLNLEKQQMQATMQNQNIIMQNLSRNNLLSAPQFNYAQAFPQGNVAHINAIDVNYGLLDYRQNNTTAGWEQRRI